MGWNWGPVGVIRRSTKSHLRLRYFGDYPLDGGQKADDSLLTNVRLGYTPTEDLSMALDILNLLDSDDHDIEYFYESQLASESEPVEDRHFHIFEPRTVRLSANYHY